MIKISDIIDIIELTLVSGYIKGNDAVSSLMIASPESGKTEILKGFGTWQNSYFVADITSYFLISQLLPRIKNDKYITHIILPDFLKVIHKRHSTAASTLMLLNQLTEEGVFQIPLGNTLYNFEGLRCGIITGITRGDMKDRRHRFHKTGVLSRFIPVSWTYTSGTKEEIEEYISSLDYQEEEGRGFPQHLQDVERHSIEVRADPKLLKPLTKVSRKYGELEGTYGFRYLKHLIRLSLASAIRDNRREVTREDIERVIYLSRYMNLSFTPI